MNDCIKTWSKILTTINAKADNLFKRKAYVMKSNMHVRLNNEIYYVLM